MHLLDVNLLIALCDADHQHRDAARHWFRHHAGDGWATCPITENAMLRVMGQPAYPGGPGCPEGVRPLLQHLRSLPGHQFWPDEISLADANLIRTLEGAAPAHLTDLYLLALAVRHRARLVTLDTRIDPALVAGGARALLVITGARPRPRP